MTTDFGDFEDSDALDTAPADPEQVAIKLWQIRQEFDSLPNWGMRLQGDRDLDVRIIARLLVWWRRQGLR